jgi:hypothetical protein
VSEIGKAIRRTSPSSGDTILTWTMAGTVAARWRRRDSPSKIAQVRLANLFPGLDAASRFGAPPHNR